MMIDGETDPKKAALWMKAELSECERRIRAKATGKNGGLERIKTCVECGKKFKHEHNRAVCCSAECRIKRIHAQQKKHRRNPQSFVRHKNRIRLKRGSFDRMAKILTSVGYTVIKPKKINLWGNADE